MEFCFKKCPFTPNLIIFVPTDLNLVSGLKDDVYTVSRVREVYQGMAKKAEEIWEKRSPQIIINQDNSIPIYVTFYFVRARQVLLITMPFLIMNNRIINDPNGVNILHRKLNAVFN